MTPRTADNPTIPPHNSPLRVRSWTPQLWWLLVPLGIVALAFVIPHLTGTSPPTVPQIAIVNNSVYDLDVTVRSAPSEGVTDIGTAQAHRTTSFDHVIDQGHTWIFGFASQGQDGGELQLSRTDLAHAGWSITIPDRVAQRLHNAGTPPSPTH